MRFTLPPEIAAKYGDADEEVASQFRELAVVDLVRRGEISKGRGAEILGLHLYDFAQVLARHNVPYYEADEADDTRFIEQYEKEHGR